jgi:predicted  nucleic acid-binding Zn-ribbon protein
MTQASESSDRLDRLEALMAQVITEHRTSHQEAMQLSQENSQQIRELTIQIKAMATFHDRFEQDLSATRQLIQSNAKLIESLSEDRRAAELETRELRRSIRDSVRNIWDIIETVQDEIRGLNNNMIDRQNPPQV